MKKTKLVKHPLSLGAVYERMKIDRQTYLDKAKEAAKYTIPTLITDEFKSCNQ